MNIFVTDIAELNAAYQTLSSIRKFFFPKKIARELDKINSNNAPLSPEKILAIYDIATQNTWFFHRWAFAALSAFFNSRSYQTYNSRSYQTDDTLHNTDLPANENSQVNINAVLENKNLSSLTSSAAKGTEKGINSLNVDVKQEMASHLPLKAIAKLARTSKSNHQLFQPILNAAKEALPLLTAVVQGNPDELIELVKANPALLFRKGQVTDPAGQTFHDVSSYQLMTFLCDDDMKTKVMPLISTGMQAIRRKQYAELDRGGADLIKMDRDPTSLPFEEVTRFIDRDPDGDRRYSLLENPDGIVYYQNAGTGTKRIYYVNQKMQAVNLIEPTAHSTQEHQALDRLYASFADMEMNSGRRSSNDEHQLIASTMQHALHRKGIEYERDGIRYCDSRMEFRLINAYRKCIRLYLERRWNEADTSWRCEVGQEQRRVMWLLQRLCEKDRPFFPLPDFKASDFKRGFETYNYLTARPESVCTGGQLVDGFGSDFAIYKGGAPDAVQWAPARLSEGLGRLDGFFGLGDCRRLSAS